jgi:hypothetical protein
MTRLQTTLVAGGHAVVGMLVYGLPDAHAVSGGGS